MAADPIAVSVLDAQATLGEGPVWDASRQVLWWVDIEEGLLRLFNPRSCRDERFEIGQRIGAVACREQGHLLLALHQGIAAFDPDTHALNILCDPEPHLPQNRFNDGKCDPAGRLWAGTMNLEPSQNLTGALYSFDRRMKATKHLSHVGVSNGLAWSTDAKIMYYIDSMSRTIDSFDYDLASGEIANRRVVFNVPTELGVADGMTIDAEDNLWVAFWGGWCVAQVDPIKKEVLRKVKLPVANVTSCTFGGQQLDELYITTARHGLSTDQLADQLHAGDLFVARPGICGLPSSPFPG